MKQQIEYESFRIIDEPGCQVTVSRPVNLTEAERARRMKQIEKATANFVFRAEAKLADLRQ